MIINVLQYLEHSAEHAPAQVAFADQEHEITFKHLLHDSQAIGSALSKALKNSHRQPVGVFIDREISCLTAFLGVTYSGNFYVPFDRDLPPARLRSMLETLQPCAFIGKLEDISLLSELGYRGLTLCFDEAILANIDSESLVVARQAAIDTDPLYAIFTSGSTGVPKCVLVSHRSVIDLIENFTQLFGFSQNTIFGNQAPFDFDVSVKDIYSTLKNSATMQVIPRELFSFPGALIAYLNQRKINTTIWATSALRIIANLKGLEKEIPQHLEKVMFSGEVMPNKVLNYWRRKLPGTTFINLYGPTEITCNCSYFIVDRPFSDDEMLPIGASFPNTEILVINEKNQLVQPGEVGEIFVRGTSLALGYYNNPEETQQAFIQNPLNPYFFENLYRTGDLGKYNSKCELLFLSRADNQIKHMGHRIELGEVELAVNALDFLEAGCCIHDEKADTIVLFYQAPEKMDREILERLRETLPRYMHPNRFVHFASLPMNKNGKIDRKVLREKYIDAPNQ